MCYHPSIAVKFGLKSNGKEDIRFKPFISLAQYQQARDFYGENRVMLIPCGHCLECRMKYRREWSLRCAVEALSYGDQNCFITLTYDDEHCPSKLIKRDLKDFFVKLYRYSKFRYFACGEYGSKNFRPHYHVIIFGYRPDDMKFDRESESGELIFTSKIIDSCWKRGLVAVQTFSNKAASYVAGYVNKKIGDDSGFITMSRRPGIGYLFYEENHLKLYKYDNVIFKGVHSLPRYFHKCLDRDGFDLTWLKEKRKDQALETLLFQLHHTDVHNLEDLFMKRRLANEEKLKNQSRRVL